MLAPIAPAMPITMLDPEFPRTATASNNSRPPEGGRPANQQQPSPQEKEKALYRDR